MTTCPGARCQLLPERCPKVQPDFNLFGDQWVIGRRLQFNAPPHTVQCTMSLLITIVSSNINIIYLISIVLSSLMSRCKPMRFCTWNAVGMLKELDTLIHWYFETLKGKNQQLNWKIPSTIKLAVQRNMLSCTMSDHNKILTEAVQPLSTVTCGCTMVALTI